MNYMQKTTTLLEKFSFSSHEAEIYDAVLRLGSPSVTEISRKIQKNRTAVYFHIKNLLSRGILKETRKGKILRFVALPPSDLVQRLEESLTDFKSIVPHLEALQKIDKETPLIEITESHRGYFKVYDEISSMSRGSTFRVLEGKDALIKEFNLLTAEEWKLFFTRVNERKIETRGLFTKESLCIPRKELTQENFNLIKSRVWLLRTLPEYILPFQQLLFIYGEKIAFLFPHTSLVVTITHRDIAKSLAAVFDGLFSFAKPIPRGWSTSQEELQKF